MNTRTHTPKNPTEKSLLMGLWGLSSSISWGGPRSSCRHQGTQGLGRPFELLAFLARPELSSTGSREVLSTGASCLPQGQAWPLDFWTSVCSGCNPRGWPEQPQVTPGLWGQGQLSDSSVDSQSSGNLTPWSLQKQAEEMA